MNVYERLQKSGKSYRNLKVKESPDRALKLSFGEIFRYSQNIMEWFRLNGYERGSRMGLLMGNTPEFMLLTYAAAAMGIITIPINTYGSQTELEDVISDSKPNILFYDSSNPYICKSMNESLVIKKFNSIDISGGTVLASGCLGLIDMNLNNCIENEEQLHALSKKVRREDILAILYTSGSTGVCKAIPKTYEAFYVKVNTFIEKTMYGLTKTGMLCMLQMCPHFHNTGFTSLMLSLFGMPFREVTFDHFNENHIVEELKKLRFRVMLGTPTMFSLIARAIEPNQYNGNLIAIISAGSTADDTFVRLVNDTLKPQISYSSYGTTECGMVTQNLMEIKYIKNWLKILLRVAQRFNIIVPSVTEKDVEDGDGATLLGIFDKLVTVKIFDKVSGAELMDGNVGEICVKLAENSLNNFNKEDIYKNEYILTGDLGFCRGRKLYLTGRSKNVINRGGEKIASHEVEQVLKRHSDIKDVIVMPITNAIYGEEVCACIIRKCDSLVEQTINEYLVDKLSKYKWPTEIHFFEKFPLTGSGKVDVVKIRKSLENSKEYEVMS